MTVFPRLFRLFIYVIITPLFVTGIFLFYYQDYSKNEILGNYSNVAQISAAFIKQNIENIALRFDFANNLPQNDTARQAFDNALTASPDFVFLALLDNSGREILRSASKEISDNIPPIDFSPDPMFKKLTFDNIAITNMDGFAPFPLAGIIYPTKDRNFLFAVVNLYTVLDKITTQPIGNTGGIYFTAQDGGLLAFNGRPMPRVNPVDMASVLSSNKNIIKDLHTLQGGRLVGAYARTALPGVYLLVLQYKREAFYTISLITWLIVFFILATTTLSYFAALSFSQEVSEPIEKLTAAAQKIERNDFNVSVDAKGAWGEFEILINTVNAMAASLNHYQALQLDKILDEKKKTDMLARLMRDGVIMCTIAGEQLFINQTAARILDSDALSSVSGGKKPALSELLKIKSGTVFTYGEGSAKAHFEIITEFFKPANEEQLAIIILRDITTEHEISEMKTDIFNSVAHDLRAPLLGLQAHIMIMQDSELERGKQKKMLNAMEQSSLTLTSLIENILDASKLERGLLLPAKTDFDISASAQKVLDVLMPLAKKRGNTMDNEIKPDTIILADKNLIGRVLSNLLSNAIKFTKSGKITVRYSRGGGYHKITVADSGIGIKEDELPKVFEKYHQANTGVKGYGLGLNISKQIINAHGGEMTVESKEGEGSQFSFTIPVKGDMA